MKSINIKFPNAQGALLDAKLELPLEQQPKAFAIFAHCFTCNKNLNAVRNISRALNKHGFGILRFDFTGLGKSQGDFSDTDFSSNVSDLELAAQYLAQEYEAPKLIIGHSLGGAAAIFAGKSIASIEAVATIGAPASPAHVQHLFSDSIAAIQSNGKATVNIGGYNIQLGKQFIEDITTKNLLETAHALRKPLLLLHSPQDTTVEIKNAQDIYQAAMHPKSFISLDGADHLLNDQADSLYSGNVIAEWATRYVTFKKKEALNTDQQVVVRNSKGSYTTDILAADHALVADEPESVGGNNFGPSPYDLLLSSLGACTAMTLRMYINRKGWDVGDILVHLTHSKDYVNDSGDAENQQAKIDIIDRTLEISGDIDEEQRQKLLEIADKCPVHKTLHSNIQVNTVIG